MSGRRTIRTAANGVITMTGDPAINRNLINEANGIGFSGWADLLRTYGRSAVINSMIEYGYTSEVSNAHINETLERFPNADKDSQGQTEQTIDDIDDGSAPSETWMSANYDIDRALLAYALAKGYPGFTEILQRYGRTRVEGSMHQGGYTDERIKKILDAAVTTEPEPEPEPVAIVYPTPYEIEDSVGRNDLRGLSETFDLSVIVTAMYRDAYHTVAIKAQLDREQIDYESIDFESAEIEGVALAISDLSSNIEYVLEMLSKGPRGVISMLDHFGREAVKAAIIAGGYSEEEAENFITVAESTDVSGTDTGSLDPLAGEGDKPNPEDLPGSDPEDANPLPDPLPDPEIDDDPLLDPEADPDDGPDKPTTEPTQKPIVVPVPDPDPRPPLGPHVPPITPLTPLDTPGDIPPDTPGDKPVITVVPIPWTVLIVAGVALGMVALKKP